MNSQSIGLAIRTFFSAVELLIVARILLSLIIRDFSNPILRFLYEITEPILLPFRKLFQMLGINTGMFDFSPLLAFYALRILSSILIRLLP